MLDYHLASNANLDYSWFVPRNIYIYLLPLC